MAVLEAEEVSVRFGGLLALDEATIAVEADQVTGLIGPNGAGKTTLFNAICGLQPVRSGHVRLHDREITRLSPHKRARKGLARTFQRLEIFGSLTVRENVLVAAEIHRRWTDDDESPAAVTDELIDRLALRDIADSLVDVLPIGLARLVEIARALATRPKVLLLDEPSSGLDTAETTWLGALLRELAGDGLAVLLVEHDIGLVMDTCTRIYALKFGKMIAAGSPDHIRNNVAVQDAYLGTGFTPTTTASPNGM